MKTILYLFILILVGISTQVIAQPILQWSERFNGPVSSDRGIAMALDTSSGSVYVACKSFGLNTDYDFLLIKYNSNGNTLWSTRFNGAANKIDEPSMIKVDHDGFVYVTGKTQKANGFYDIVTIKYDSSGTVIWNTIYNGTITTGDDISIDITIDDIYHNVYVAGSTFDHFGSVNEKRGILIKYNSLGVKQWSINKGDEINKIIINNNSNILISSNKAYSNFDIYEINESTGAQIYNYHGLYLPSLKDLGYANDFTIDNAGNIYILSTIDEIFHKEVCASRFINGNTNTLVYSGVYYSDDNIIYTGVKILLDKDLNVYSLGKVSSSINYFTLTKLNSSMGILWHPAFSLDNGGSVFPVSLSFNPNLSNTNLFVSGYTSTGDIFTWRFSNEDDVDPQVTWYDSYDCGNNGPDNASMMVQDQYDNIYITGYSNCNGSNDDVKTLKYCVNVPAQPTTISGNILVCQGDTTTYSVDIDSSAESYTWSLPSGWTGSSITNSINAVPGTSGMISVVANGHTCSSVPRTLNVTTHTVPLTPGNIIGDNSVCSGTDQTFSIQNVPDATSYTWHVPPGWSGASAITSILAVTGNLSGNITVKAENECGSSPEQTFLVNVTVTPVQPDTIIGDLHNCNGDPKEYSVPQLPGIMNYWSGPPGWNVPVVPSTSIICFPITTDDLFVYSKNGECISPTKSIHITSNYTPAPPDTIYGKLSICSSNSESYYIQEVPGASSYNWSNPSSWIGQSNNSSIVYSADTSGLMFVTAENECGESNPVSLFVIVNDNKPLQPSIIQGAQHICTHPNEISNEIYTVMPQNDASEFVWNQLNWGTSNTNKFIASIDQEGGTLTVFAKNGCGFSQPQSISIQVTSIDTSIITTGSSLISKELNALAYKWVDCSSLDTVAETLSNIYEPTASGDYKVVLLKNDCIDESSCRHFEITSLEDKIKDNNNISIFPNPTNGELIVSSDKTEIDTIEIYTSLGQSIFKSVGEHHQHLVLNLQAQPQGTYIALIKVGGLTLYKQIIKI